MSLRILTVRDPWGWALLHGGKTVENRPRNIAGSYRGPVAIHVALQPAEDLHRLRSWPELLASMHATITSDDTLEPGRMPWQTNAGHIVGVADLVDVHKTSRSTVPSRVGEPVCWDESTPPGHLCSPWAEPDSHHLVFANPRALVEPIPFTGALGMRHAPFELAGDWIMRKLDRCTCPAGVHLGDQIGHAPGCGLEQAGHLRTSEGSSQGGT